MGMRRAAVVSFALGFCSVGVAAFAVDSSSPNFQNDGSTFAPAVFDASSPSFQLNGAVDAIVGLSGSANFNVRHGVPVKDTIVPPTPPQPPSGGGGGGGGGGGYTPPATTTTTTPPVPTPSGKAKAPTLIYRSPTFLSHQVIGGARDATTVSITVNGSANGVQFTANDTWQRDMPLFIGYNDIRVQATDNAGLVSDVIGGQIERMLVGDSSRGLGPTFEHVVDDVDISLFTRAWRAYNFYSDFNEDGVIDDADLSLLASNWGRTVSY